MRLLLLAAASLAALAAPPARAQLSNHSISVESGLSAPLGAEGGASAAFALAASAWLHGDVEVVARASRTAAPATADRAADSALCGTLGLRLSVGRAPLRGQLQADVGWARLGGSTGADRLALGAGAALEAFPAPDLSLALRTALRAMGSATSLEATLAAAVYF